MKKLQGQSPLEFIMLSLIHVYTKNSVVFLILYTRQDSEVVHPEASEVHLEVNLPGVVGDDMTQSSLRENLTLKALMLNLIRKRLNEN